MRTSVFLLLLLLFFGCRKKNKEYTIAGKLLTSSSNAVPVKGLHLALYQSGSPGSPIGSSSSSSANTITDAQGNFRFEYIPGKSFFAGIPGRNGSPVTISHQDTAGMINNFYWFNIPGIKDTVLGNMFLYKKINRLIIKVSSFKGLSPSDSLDIRGTTVSGPYRKWLTGRTIPAGAEVIVDTVYNFVAQRFDVNERKFTSDLAVAKKGSGFTSAFVYPFDPLDEVEKTLTVFVE